MAARLKIVSLMFGIACLCVVVQLFRWQIIRGSDLSQEARSQQVSSQRISAHRGEILASDGTPLASTREAWLLYANPQLVEDSVTKISDLLAPMFIIKADDPSDEEREKEKTDLREEESRINSLLSSKDLVWVPIKKKMTTEMKNNIEELKIAGLDFERQEARYYPEGSSSAQILGFVGKDDAGQDTGYFGLEGYYNLSLAGKPGYRVREANALGAPILFGNEKGVSASEGVDLLTSIDKTVQLTVEQKLSDGMQRYGAKAGTVIVMNPKNGEILAMASTPSYDPGKYYEYGDDYFRNPAISDAFEPGSIFKPIVMAAGIDAGLVTPDTICDICDRPYQVDRYFIRTWNNEYHANSTMTDVIKHSDNVGMAFVGNKLGADKLYDYLANFGFGSQTGIDLQGEMTPAMRARGTWNIVDLATTTFGQGIAVTPIQMIQAVGAIANKGMLMVPRVVTKMSSNVWSEDVNSPLGRQVISSSTASDVTNMMEVAAEEGEAKWAIPKGFRIAGKTGTAQIPVAGHYDDEKTIASFVGFAPAEDPRFVMLVILKEPESSQWASETAAPLWFGIAKELFRHLGIRPESY